MVEITITLDEYELGNLLALFKRHPNDDNGDWFSQILWKLGEQARSNNIEFLISNFGDVFTKKTIEKIGVDVVWYKYG